MIKFNDGKVRQFKTAYESNLNIAQMLSNLFLQTLVPCLTTCRSDEASSEEWSAPPSPGRVGFPGTPCNTPRMGRWQQYKYYYEIQIKYIGATAR